MPKCSWVGVDAHFAANAVPPESAFAEGQKRLRKDAVRPSPRRAGHSQRAYSGLLRRRLVIFHLSLYLLSVSS